VSPFLDIWNLMIELSGGIRFSVDIPCNASELGKEESPTTETVISKPTLEQPIECSLPLILIGDDNKANIMAFFGYLKLRVIE
jgi:hypothetical protein